MGDPSQGSQPGSPKFSGKLRGEYAWPFTMKIPAHVTLPSPSGVQESWRVPPSFSERLARVHIQYQLICHFRRGKFRVDSKYAFLCFFLVYI